MSYITFGCTPNVFFQIPVDKMPKVPQYFWDDFGKLFFSRLQTFSIILMSGEFGGQFSKISNPFSENQVFERIELSAAALSCCNFSPKNISGNRLSSKICKYLIEFIFPDFLETFPTIEGNKNPKALIFVPFQSFKENLVFFEIISIKVIPKIPNFKVSSHLNNL